MILTYDEYYPDFKQTAPSDITFEGVECQTIPRAIEHFCNWFNSIDMYYNVTAKIENEKMIVIDNEKNKPLMIMSDFEIYNDEERN